MANPNKTRGKSSREKPALQLTSYQLVMAICTLLLLGCILFVAGILVQRFSEDGPAAKVAERTDSPRTKGLASGVDTARPPTEGVQVEPRPVILPSDSQKANSSAARTVKDRESGAKYIPAPPPRRDSVKKETPSVASPEAAKEKAASETKTDTPAMTVPAVAPPEPPVAPKEPMPEETELAKNSEETPAAPPAQPKPEVSARAAGPYTIQLASFDSGNLDRAKRFKSETEEAMDLTVNLIPSSDGKHIRAFVGDYADRSAADQARDAMRKVKGFEDCFVKSLSEE